MGYYLVISRELYRQVESSRILRPSLNETAPPARLHRRLAERRNRKCLTMSPRHHRWWLQWPRRDQRWLFEGRPASGGPASQAPVILNSSLQSAEFPKAFAENVVLDTSVKNASCVGIEMVSAFFSATSGPVGFPTLAEHDISSGALSAGLQCDGPCHCHPMRMWNYQSHEKQADQHGEKMPTWNAIGGLIRGHNHTRPASGMYQIGSPPVNDCLNTNVAATVSSTAS